MEQTQLGEVGWWTQQIARGLASGKFDCPRFLKPYHFALLGSAAQRAGLAQLVVPEELRGFAARMHLWQAIGLTPPVNVRERDPEGRFLPLAPLLAEAELYNYAERLRQIAKWQGEVDKETLNSLDILLHEILGNCFHHAAVQPGCFALTCAQAWSSGSLAQVAIVDPGVGVRASLAKNSDLAARLLAENACSLATELHVTGKPIGHSGYGLALARQLVVQNGGNFILASGREAFQANSRGTREANLHAPWEGTIVILEWRTDRPLDVGSVYASWPQSDDDFI